MEMNPVYENMEIAVRGHFRLDDTSNDKQPIKVKSRTKSSVSHSLNSNTSDSPLQPYYTLTFDTEVIPDVSQKLRVGYYELRGLSSIKVSEKRHSKTFKESDLDTLVEAGFILGDESDELHYGDLKRIRDYAAKISYRGVYRNIQVKVLSKQQFIKDIFYRYGYHGYCPDSTSKQKEHARIVGFNLPFDISRFVTKYGPANAEFDGGFWMLFCDCPHGQENNNCAFHPPLRLNKIGRSKYMYAFRHESFMSKSGVRQNYGYEGNFVDAQTFGIALSPSDNGQSLAAMCKQYKVENKEEHPDFNAPINDAYLQYLIQDVRSTYFLFRAELHFYSQWGFGKKPEYIYSSASMAKTLLQELGIPKFYAGDRDDINNIGWDITDEIRGYVAETIHGGRAEIGARLTIVESILLDFSSEYPLINNLLRLQDFWASHNVKAIDATTKARKILSSKNLLRQLQDKSFWLNMRMIIAVKDVPKSRPAILPTRAKYNTNIYNESLPYVSFKGTIWYTIADVIASILLTGNVPEIEKAIEFVPVGKKRKTNIIRLMGDDRYTINLARDDLYTRLIDLRHEISEAAKTSDNPDLFNATALSLKLIANSGAYGIQLEQTPLERVATSFKLHVFSNTHDYVHATTYDKPGKYFAGPIATLIPAGGRLLLAICERLAYDNGLHYAFMDTDSICLTRPLKSLGQREISREEFRKRVSAIAHYFDAINPYKNTNEVLKYEKVNYDKNGKLRELYCIAVSSKRYVLFTKNDDKTYTIVKLSSHGLGGWSISKDYKIPNAIPDKPSGLACHDYIYTLWYNFIRTLDTGKYHAVNGKIEPLKSGDSYYVYTELDNGLSQLAYSQYTLSHPSDMARFKFDDVMPFNFLTVMPQPKPFNTFGTEIWRNASPYYTGYCDSETQLRKAINSKQVFRIRDGKMTTKLDHFDTMQQVLYTYFIHNEAKALNGDSTGIMKRRYINIRPTMKVIGKESNRIAIDNADDTAGIIGGRLTPTVSNNNNNTDNADDLKTYGATYTNSKQQPLSKNLIDLIKSNDNATLMSATGLSANAITKIKSNIHGLFYNDIINTLEDAEMVLNPDTGHGEIYNWRNKISVNQLAEILHLDYNKARDKYMGRTQWSTSETEKLIFHFIDLRMDEDAVSK